MEDQVSHTQWKILHNLPYSIDYGVGSEIGTRGHTVRGDIGSSIQPNGEISLPPTLHLVHLA